MATLVARTRLSVTLYVLWLSCSTNFVVPNQFHRTNALYFSSSSKLLLTEENRVKPGDLKKIMFLFFFGNRGS